MGKLQLLLLSAIAFFVVNHVSIDATTSRLEFDIPQAEAKRSGGRSRGGSFSRPSRSSSPSRNRTPSRSSSPPKNSTPSQNEPASSDRNTAPQGQSGGNTGGRVRGGSFDRQPTATPTPAATPLPTATPAPATVPPVRQTQPSSPNTVIVPVPIPVSPPRPYYNPGYNNPNDNNANTVENSESGAVVESNSPPTTNTAPSSAVSSAGSTNSGGFPWRLLLILLVAGIGVFILWRLLSKSSDRADKELDNDIVTVTKLQVALLAEARSIQSHLTQLSLHADLETPEGLAELLQETALALLRQPECWSHVLSSSETVKSREEASRIFNQISIGERSKFSAETLTNVNGRVRQQQSIEPEGDLDPAEYIVVTLLVGTEDDKPLFDPVRSTEELERALKQLAAISPEYLLVYELLWTPQADTDSLSYDELLTEYTQMLQV
ncbi:MAG: DUF1517 domain-containing protein [Cyanobacteriota bacterium]|nr:DUF1517 domain-containing protein [Cyanobacteriota bacterium]